MASCKFCPKCKTMKSITEYAKLYDGVQHWCRDCARNYKKQRKLENENAEESKSHLYVMSYVGVPPGIYKVGQSTECWPTSASAGKFQSTAGHCKCDVPRVGLFGIVRARFASYASYFGLSVSGVVFVLLETVLNAIATAHRQQPPPVDKMPRPLARTLDSYFGSSAVSAASDDTQNGAAPSPPSATRWEFQ